MNIAAAREEAVSKASLHASIGYITVEHVEGERVCFLHDAEGIEIVASRCGMSPLFVYAADRRIQLLTRH